MRVCLPVAVGHGPCWLVAVVVGVILCRHHFGQPKIDKNRQQSTKSTRYMLQNSRGVFFLRSPKRRRQLRPDAPWWETLKPANKVFVFLKCRTRPLIFYIFVAVSGSPSPDDHQVLQILILQVDIQTKVRKIQELLKKLDFD